MIETQEVSLSDVNRYLKTVGRRGEFTMRQLGKIAGFLSAWNTEDGQNLLKMDVIELRDLGDKLWNGTITQDEMADFRAVKKRIEKIAILIATKERLVTQITKSI
jgi:hypothetical protein